MSVRPPEERVQFEARLLSAIGQPVVATDVEFRVVYWNRGAEIMLGYKAEEMLGSNLIESVALDLGDVRMARAIDRLASGSPLDDEVSVRKRDGTRLPILVLVTPILDDGAELVGMVIVASDISERKSSEATMAQLSAIVESSSDGIIGMDLGGTITSWNAGAEQLFGYKSYEILGSAIAVLTDSAAAGEVAGLLDALATGRVVEGIHVVRRRSDGTAAAVESTVYPVRGTDGTLIGAAAISRDITARQALEGLAEEEHGRLEEAQRIAQVGSFEFDLRTGESQWSRELRRILGVGPDAPSDYRVFVTHIHPDDYDRVVVSELAAGITGPKQLIETEFRVVGANGELRWVSVRIQVSRDAEGEALTLVGSIQDITDQKANARARQLAEEQFAIAFDLGKVGMLVMDLQRQILRVNPAFCEMVGRHPEEVLGKTPNEFAHPSEASQLDASATESMIRTGGEHLHLERRFVRPNGGVVYVEMHVSVVRDANGEPQYLLAQVVDITDRKRVEDELQRLAMHDPLTGLPNRYLLQDRLETAIARARRSKHHVVVLFIDVDHFKLVNDSLGHATGDTLLVQLAGRLTRLSRAGDTVARFGGDEFVMVCEDVEQTNEAPRIGARLLKLFDEPFVINEQQLYVTVSAGVVVAGPTATPVTVLRDADAAMYQAKERGRARAEMYDEALRHRAAKRLDIEMMLRHALERNEFRVVYQPVVSLPGEMPVGMEALLRWEHPERGTLSPTEFIPAAEETGLVVPIGAWVLDEALAQLAIWRDQLPGAKSLFVAVNLSPRQLVSGDLLARCRDATAGHGVPADFLCLEITEGAVMQDVDVSIPILRKISESGIRLAVDDFGSGYSSLSYLKRLPVRTLKIDRSFVAGLGHDADDSAIVRAIVSLGYALGLELCAEGVETPEQRAELAALGCHLGQGYLWAPAMRADAFKEWYQRRLAAHALD
jgi:diguanylate cyclase (GGDEF)-like protein/PAS domain S-box-containing protein